MVMERFAFTNFGASIDLQAVGEMPGRVRALNDFFEYCRAGDEYDRAAITHVVGSSSHFPGCLINSVSGDGPQVIG